MSLPSCSRWLSGAPLAGVERQGRGALGSGGLAVGIPYSLSSDTHYIQGTHPFSGVQSRFHQGQGLGGGGSFSVGEGSNRARSPPISGVLQPVICGDENLRVVEAGYRPVATEPEDSEDILQDGDSPVGTCWRLDVVSRLKDAYLQVPMHPESRKFLRFVACGKVYQFKVLCFGLSTAPQVFTWVMAPVSAFLH